ncbi:LysM peptidoglycan-binding domain-containing protein [Lactobacillus ruminis]|uniref:LysM peptidoglycan-binding domain-containing protein n=1 Tax=Ligilactobacillus ruminis TaxID=1623 RepID=UPI00102298B6|nr:LysM peptidoglycan-binding domain-containing protein [Ligilactobacillus ruminis]MSB44926.1 LysM peptidoglycan-binding domain-containing protein [Ligilactobacillus ruminis]MSB55304.1 LysM peptidoglycan-binding domain-containing protein [Ligilactobacillus ruminis]MSB57235.1 LysM peptidoglycan-binding domain-containing protein [Ligilactobacillus ruminis]MSB82302.1 LysM peptidoglycan-binding domain-containing protein [Ligilactobacillus ruminis]MSB91930.1 LysM peptidoglycan-binding domain-contai
MKKRKERIEREKQVQALQNIRSVKKATTYIGTTVLMGTAGFALSSRTKVSADTVQVDKNGQTNGNQQASSQSSSDDTQQSASSSSESQNNTVGQTQRAEQQAQQTTQQPAAQNQQTQQQSIQTDQTEQDPQTETQADVSTQQAVADVPMVRAVQTNSSYSGNVQSFLNNVAPAARQVASARGLYASLMIAQAALESGWGGSYLSTAAYNLFGVKWNGSGAYINLSTQEYYGGAYHTVMARFQRYSSYTESLNAYADLICSHFPRSTKAQASSYAVAAQNLRNGVYGTYATDPSYASKLISVIERYNLTQYDTGTVMKPVSNNTNSNNNNSNNNSNTSVATNGTYTAVAGDSLWGIAHKFGMTLDELKKANGLTSNNLYVGQTLKVRKSAQQNTNDETNQNQNSNGNNNDRPQQTVTSAGTYTVKSGDSLWGIATKHGCSVNDLKSWNHLSSNLIYIGQKLVIGQKKSTVQQQQGKKEPQQTTSNETYTVKSGDSLWKIATNHNMSVYQLKNLNKLSNDMIFVGQKLVVSEKKQSAPSQNQVTKPSTYTVKSGDSVWKIAHECGMSMNELVSLNGIKNNLIFPGQVLKVKAGAKAENVSKSETSGSKNQNAASNGSSSTYTVKSGDSVWKISHEHGMSMDELKSLNGLKDNLIIPGQVLKIKGTSSNTKQKIKTSSKETAEAGATYVVKSGDSLWAVANKQGLTVAELKRINGLSSDTIYVGQRLKVTQKSSVNAKTYAKTTNASDKSKKKYTVKAGDSLWRIAADNKTTVNNLKAVNHLASDTIYVGQTLYLN